MKDLNIVELYRIKKRLINEDMSNDELMQEVIEAIKYQENLILETSATGGPAGMGSVVSAQPSGLAGQTIGPNWGSNGGTTGSGDVSVPYNPGGSNRMSQKIPVPMGKDHGSRTGKKSRTKRLDMKTLQNIFKNRPKFGDKNDDEKPGEKKVMDFKDFIKADVNKVKK
jgi:hypothetical protein